MGGQLVKNILIMNDGPLIFKFHNQFIINGGMVVDYLWLVIGCCWFLNRLGGVNSLSTGWPTAPRGNVGPKILLRYPNGELIFQTRSDRDYVTLVFGITIYTQMQCIINGDSLIYGSSTNNSNCFNQNLQCIHGECVAQLTLSHHTNRPVWKLYKMKWNGSWSLFIQNSIAKRLVTYIGRCSCWS